MKVHSHNLSRSPSLSRHSSCSFITPRKVPSNFIKGLNITITKIKDNHMLNTRDKTTTPKSHHKNIHFNTPITKYLPLNQQLFSNPIQYSPFQTRFTSSKNKSLPAFKFHHHQSGFSNITKPYNKLTSSPAFKPHSSTKSITFSPFTPTSSPNYQNLEYMKKKISPFSVNPLNFETRSNNKFSPTFDNFFEPVCLNSDPRVKQCKVSEIYVAQTPKKQNSMREGFALKNLRKRLTKNSSEEGPSTISSKGKFQSDKKKDSKELQFSLNMEQAQNQNLKLTQKLSKMQLNVEKEKTTTRSKKEREQFFNLTPRESQQLDIQVFELTQSNSKQKNEKDYESTFSKKNTQRNTNDISFIKPVKRKLEMNCEEQQQNEDLNESLIIEEVLSSLTKNKEPKREQMTSFGLELIRKCSNSLCLTRNNETNCLFGLVRLESKQKFIDQEENKTDGQMCVRKYFEWGQYVIFEPFEYTLEEIFEMKLVDEKSIQELIRKFHRTLNEIKEKKKGKINFRKLKERIVYTHGQFRLIPIVEKP